jgi:hypothetical protein
LTGFYPLYTDEENIRLDKEIDDLIQKTDLYVPATRTCLNISEHNKDLFKTLNLKRCVLLDDQSDVVLNVSNRKVITITS